MRLVVSTEVEPAVFDEAELAEVGARVIRHVHMGWFSADCEADRVGDLRRLKGVLSTLVIQACDERLDQLPEDLRWKPLGEADCHGLLGFRLEAGTVHGRTVALRLRADVRQACFVRSHLTSGMDIVLSRADPGAPGGRRVAARHSEGLRDRTGNGMQNWKEGENRQITMWVGHLPAGRYTVEAGLVDGWIRVGGPLVPFTFEAEVELGQA